MGLTEAHRDGLRRFISGERCALCGDREATHRSIDADYLAFCMPCVQRMTWEDEASVEALVQVLAHTMAQIHELARFKPETERLVNVILDQVLGAEPFETRHIETPHFQLLPRFEPIEGQA
jgi:hypothetical protein